MALNGRAVMLALAENETIKRTLVRNGMSKGMVQRFVAGETLDDAIAAAHRLKTQHIGTALDLLGENVGTEAEARASADAYIGVLTAVAAADLPAPYISIKLTALGLDLGDDLATANLRRVLTAAQSYPEAFVRVDMEGSAYTQRTLDIVRAAHRDFGNVGTVLQSYLRRTDDDLAQLIADGISVRLVKGAYAEPASVAYPDKADVDVAYARQMRELLMHGNHPAIASHDEAILREAKRFVREQRIKNTQFEFQMLLGIRRDLQESLAAEGYFVRAYVPFGVSWYPYFMRRLAERPANIGFILKNLIK
ncbi:MAG: proline dehydrogenase family protein [Janthinobacterium lividum]